MVAELQTVSREACTAMIEHAYAMGYMDAKERERKRKKALREKRERKKVFHYPKVIWGGGAFPYRGSSQIIGRGCNHSTFHSPVGCNADCIQRNADYQ